MQENNPTKQRAPLSLISFVLGLIAVIGSFVWPIAFIVAIIAIVVGLRALSREKNDIKKRAQARRGIVLGFIAIVLVIMWVILTFTVLPKTNVDKRDNARINDLSLIEKQIAAYRQQNQRQLPNATDLSVSDLTNVKQITSSGQPSTSTVVYLTNTNCRGDTLKNGYALRIVLEETGKEYCRGY